MDRMNALLIGYGEIGKGVKSVFEPYHRITVFDPAYNNTKPEKEYYDILLVAIPFSDKFIDIVKGYLEEYHIKHCLVFSTTAIGTCEQIPANHCPVEGKHPDLAKSIRITDKWLGGSDDICKSFLEYADFIVFQFPSPKHTEFLKLRSTTVYGVNIEFARYCKMISDDIGLDYNAVKKWDTWYNKLYADFGETKFTRPILDPPIGKKGGHCVTPNAIILNKQYPNPMVEIVAEQLKLF